MSGSMGPKALARAAKWASGIDDPTTIFGIDPAGVEASFGRIRQAWAEAGRTDTPHISASLWYGLGEGAEQRVRDYAYKYLEVMGEGFATACAETVTCFSPDALCDAVSVLEELGCDELFLVPTTADVTELYRTRDALGI